MRKEKNLILVILKSLDCVKYCLYAKSIVFISDIKAKTDLSCLLSKCLLKANSCLSVTLWQIHWPLWTVDF